MFLMGTVAPHRAAAQGLGGAPSTEAETESNLTAYKKTERLIKPAKERAMYITQNMQADLKLTEEQAKKIYIINLEASQKMDVLRKKYRSDPVKLLKEGSKVDREHDQKLSNILKPSQWAQYRRGKSSPIE